MFFKLNLLKVCLVNYFAISVQIPTNNMATYFKTIIVTDKEDPQFLTDHLQT